MGTRPSRRPASPLFALLANKAWPRASASPVPLLQQPRELLLLLLLLLHASLLALAQWA